MPQLLSTDEWRALERDNCRGLPTMASDMVLLNSTPIVVFVTRFNWNIVESGVKDHKYNPCS